MTHLVEHKIELIPNTKPVHRLPYRASPQMRNEMQKLITEQIHQDVIEECDTGAWASPTLFVKKKDQHTLRLVVDYRKLNASTLTQYLRVPLLVKL